MPLQRAVVQAGGAWGGKPTGGITLHEGVPPLGIVSGEELEQPATGPVLTGGVKPVKTVFDQGKQLRQPELNIRHEAASLTGRTGEETLQQLIGGEASGNR